MRVILKRSLLVILAVIMSFGLFNEKTLTPTGQMIDFTEQIEHKFEELPVLNLPEDTYMSYTYFRDEVAFNNATVLAINLATWDKIIRFDTADELHRFSMDVSYNLKYSQFETKLSQPAIAKLLSLHYTLGRDIDYSVMKSKKFNPIGYDFILEGVPYQQSFTGTFDGNGFEISNLYFSGYNELTEILYEGTEIETEVSYIKYYAMFAYNEGIIRNFGIINPTYEFNFENSELYRAANIVGKNFESGIVHHVYAIDTRSVLIGGVRMVTSAGQAAGVMYENNGTFHNAYYAGRAVVNASYGSRFSVQPVLFQNVGSGIHSELAFDDTLYQESVTVGGSSYNITTPNALATSMTTSELRNVNAVLGAGWFYYPAENNPTPKYPSLLGLTYVSSPIQITLDQETNDTVTLSEYFVIEDALDLIAFSKLLNYTRSSGLTPYRELNYVISGNIDMQMVSANSYLTPTVEFSGTFTGIDNDVYIYGLNIVNGIAQESYYAGMFSILTGSVYNLMIIESSLTLTETDNFAGVKNYIGFVAGDAINATIRNVLLDVTIDLGHKTLGELYVGTLVGRASGIVSSIYATGTLESNQDHIYRSDILINPAYYIGGIIGKSGESSLFLYDAINAVTINGIGTSSTSMLASSNPTIHMGGVIGAVEQYAEVKHTLGLLTHQGLIKPFELVSQYTETQYIGGVIGTSYGPAHTLNANFGNFRNQGEIDVRNRGTNQVYTAGVLVSNHSEPVEFVHLFNEEQSIFTYYTEDGGNILGNFNNLDYTTLVYNIGSSLTLSQSYNDQAIDLYGAPNYSGLYVSSQNAYTLLRFVENRGKITLKNQTLSETQSIAGISLSENIDYINVVFSGGMDIYNITMQTTTTTEKQLFVAGFAKTITQGRVIKNSVVLNDIVVGGILSNTLDRTPRNNIYVAGFVNYNNSGDMDPNGTLSYPVATMGIINSINQANIHSTFSPTHYGITGHANLFAGGITTFNDGDIQNSSNLGDIRFENLSNVDTSNVRFDTNSTSGGKTIEYRYGVITGGIAASVMSFKSRIYDSSNNGQVIALSKNFARAGGILAVAIFQEITTGNVFSPYTANNNRIEDSILSNCINNGDVSSITISIASYGQSSTWQTLSGGITNNYRFDITQDVTVPGYNNTYYSSLSSSSVRILTESGSEERPGINAAAGGVIGYGLSVMRRMINHGQISSTDVAGGVVGATVVLTTAYVKIDTAINYGSVRAFERGSGNANFNAVDIMDYETIRDGFYPVNSTFIFPDAISDMRIAPEDKRGIGGIFGRLQRAANQYMIGNGSNGSVFNFIVNMDPNVDLIGRLDQVHNYLSSLRFFDFRNSIYYSARKNDTTQAVFTGVYFFYTPNNGTKRRYDITVSITSRKYEYTFNGASGQWERRTYQRTMNRTEIWHYGVLYKREGNETPTNLGYNFQRISRDETPAHGGGGWSYVANSLINVGSQNEYKYVYDLPLYSQVWDIESSRIELNSNFTNVPNGYYIYAGTLPVRTITEEASDPQGEYVYSPTFEMQTDPVLQEYIYYAENGNLSDTFMSSRPNGMYVLATSSGSTFGSILPANLNFTSLLPIDQSLYDGLPRYDINYDEVPKIDPTSNPDYEALLNGYEELFQTRYSDQSIFLDETEDQAVLNEIAGNYTKLLNPTFNNSDGPGDLGVITFDLHLTSLDFSSGFATVNFHLDDVELPVNAVLARTIEDYYGLPYGSNISSYIASYQALLQDYVNPEIPDIDKPNLRPVLSHTFNAQNLSSGIINLGYVRSYSQVSQYFPSFMNQNYTTDYLIRLNVIYNPSATNPYAYSYQIDGGTTRTSVPSNITVQNVTSTLRINFRDTFGVLPIGTDFMYLGSPEGENIVLEYFDPNTSSYVMVDYEDYNIQSIPSVNQTHRPFSFTIVMNPSLKGGAYRVGYSVLPYQTSKIYHTFTKNGSTARQIEEIAHYSQNPLSSVGTSFTTNVNFGYTFDFSSTTPVPVMNPDAKPYQSDVLYYELPFLTKLDVSDFSYISSVTVNNVTHVNGYRRYQIVYQITSESGATTTYTHTINERPIAIQDVYRNNNKVVMNSLNPVVVTREAFLTTISINYGVDPTYSSSVYNTVTEDPTAYFGISPEVDGITLTTTSTYLVFEVDETALAGLYAFDVTYYRQGEPNINMGTVYIRKNQGTDAYLLDIQFAELATETNYAKIYVSNTSGVPISSPYTPNIYYAGIDYDGADLNDITQFRVDGQVSNIPIDDYIPFFLNYLPLGSTIQRKLSDGSYTVGVTGPDDPNLGVLAADFTSQEGSSENDDIIITYRVVSEDGLNYVDYHITVTDITYNVSYIFDVIYIGNDLKPHINNSIVLINVRNMITNLPVTDTIVTTLPAFDTVIEYTNSTNLFFMVNQNPYKFRFGRNRSGFFSFNVTILDQDGYIYDVEIALNGTDPLSKINTYDLDSKDQGHYYYINSSTKNRTRYFTITISNAREADRDYGFSGKDGSWLREND